MPFVSYYETVSLAGSGKGRVNEDFASIDVESRHVVLVDGATGLTKAHITGMPSDAQWYAQCLVRECEDHMDGGADPAFALRIAGEHARAAFMGMKGADELGRIDLPNASVAVMSWDDESLEVVMLGDCTVVVGLKNSESVVVHDSALDALDHQNYERMYDYARHNKTTMEQARKDLNECFIENRLKMNEAGGYWAADISCKGFGHELTLSYDAADVRFVFACTDGFANACDMGVARDLEQLANAVAQGQGKRIAKELRDAEERDASCWRVHRSKTSDDATYTVACFD